MSTLTTQLKSDIDKLWTEFWTGGITNPLTVIEQISFLMFARLLDVRETGERRATRVKKPFKGRFGGANDPRRWKNFRQKEADEMLRVIRDEVFPHFRKLNGGTTFAEYMQDAQLMIQKPSLLVSAVNMIDKLPITEGDAKGDLYEYLLSKLTTAGINGQFRTPRHIIRFMVDLLEPKPDDTIGDPACGTAGFLVGVMQYLLEHHTSGSSKAHTALRKLLVKDNQLEGVFSLPSGVFKPYAGVSTAILVFSKGGKTDHVFFYDVDADGFSLDDKRDPVKQNDLPDALARWKKQSVKKDTDRTAKHFMVPVAEIEGKGFDLSINRYKEAKHEEVKYDPPKKIIAKLRALEAEIAKDLSELEAML